MSTRTGEGERARSATYPSAFFGTRLGASPLSPLSRWSPVAPARDPESGQGSDRQRGLRGQTGRRRLLIIARDRKSFYEAAKLEFAGRTDIKVVLDARREPRRQLSGPRVLERRFFDRRQRRDVDALIRANGWAVVYLDADGRASAQP